MKAEKFKLDEICFSLIRRSSSVARCKSRHEEAGAASLRLLPFSFILRQCDRDRRRHTQIDRTAAVA